MENHQFLRILFVNVKRTGGGNRTILASPATLKFLRSRLSVSLIYLDVLGPFQWGVTPGNACFNRGDSDGTVQAIYHFSTEYSPCHVWFSHRKRTQSTTYILSNCASKARALLLLCASGKDYHSLLRPMVVDAILADSAAEKYKVDLQDSRDLLLQYEHHGASHLPNELVQDTFQKLHQLSKTWHILNEELVNLEEALSFVLHVHKSYIGSPVPSSQYPSIPDGSKDTSPSNITPNLTPNHETLEYLLTRNTIWKRWLSNYTTRTNIRINLHFNLASQTDNKTNLAVASTSKTIAEATLHDSSSMITIATMTMLFLPGTFVCAILSMSVFDNSGQDAQGRPTLRVLPQWWIFPVATVVLTGFVVSIWRIWQLKRLEQNMGTAKKQGTSANDAAHSHGGDSHGILGKWRRRHFLIQSNAQLATGNAVAGTMDDSGLEEQREKSDGNETRGRRFSS